MELEENIDNLEMEQKRYREADRKKQPDREDKRAKMKDGNSIEENLTCTICTDIFQDPVIVDCCGNTFCQICLEKCKSKCPFCQKRTQCKKNLTVKNIVECMETVCICGIKFPRRDKERHLEVCLILPKKCKYCIFEGSAEARARHGIDTHLDRIIERFVELLE